MLGSIRKDGAIVGVGSALMDMLLTESDSFLASVGASKGGMTLVDAERIAAVLKATPQTPVMVPGGSACNTIIGAGRLGSVARFIGKRGTDEIGTALEQALRDNAVDPRLALSDSPTGRVLSIVTPDAQRSMFTFLGASAEARGRELAPDYFRDAAIVHIEGYLLFNPELIEAALRMAREAGALVSLDLASYTVVQASRDLLNTLVDRYVDILIANEDEAREFTGLSDEEASLEALAKRANIAVVKIGKRGSLIASATQRLRIAIMGDGTAVDTTGAGDLWAAGFLHGLARGYDLETSGHIGAACGYEVCQVMGAHIPAVGWDRIRRIAMKGTA